MFDLIVIGGGPAGYLAAERAGHAGLKVVLFEKNSLGGVCLNEGCIPSKALLNSAKLYEHALHSEKYGVTVEGAKMIICSGSSAVVPPIPGVRENIGGFVVTNREVLELPEVPKNFVVIGGGVIGLEMVA